MDARPLMIAADGHFTLWQYPGGPEGAFRIYDQRCPRAHAHCVWSGADEGAALDALASLAASPPPFLPCAPGVKAFDP